VANQNFRVKNGLEVGTGATLSSTGTLTVTNLTVTGITTLNVLSSVSATGAASTQNVRTNSLNVSGVSTLGVTTATQLSVSGVSTFAGITTVTGETLFTNQLSVSGVSTFAGVTTNTSTLFANQLSVSGVSTLGVTTTTSLSATQLSISGVSTFAGVTTNTSTLFANQLSVVGPSTFIGVTTSSSTLFANQLSVSGVSTFAGITTVTGTTLFSRQLNVSGVSTFNNDIKLSAKILDYTGSVGSGSSVLTATGVGVSWTSAVSVAFGSSTVSLLDFGGDPTFTSDSSPAFDKALAYLKTKGGGTIFIPAGIFKIGSQVDPDGVSNITIRGVGNASILKFADNYRDNDSRWLFNQDNISQNPSPDKYHNNWSLMDFCFDGNAYNMGPFTAVDDCRRDKIVKLFGNNFQCSGLFIKDEAGRGFITWLGDQQVYDRCIFNNIGVGASDSSVLHPGNSNSPASNVVISNCVGICTAPYQVGSMILNATAFVDAVTTKNLSIVGCAFSGGENAMLVSWHNDTDCNNVTISGNTVETLKGYGLHIYNTNKNFKGGVGAAKTMRNLSITGNTFLGNSSILIDGDPQNDIGDNHATSGGVLVYILVLKM